MLIRSRNVEIVAQGGFSLIELAIVLVIIGAFIGSFIGTLGSRIENTRFSESKADLDEFKVALYGYAVSQGIPHLPCPDCRAASCQAVTAGNFANDGIEDRDGPVCDANADGTLGNLPWETLGIGENDPWGNRYSYWVSDTVADNTAPGFQLTTLINTAIINTRYGENIAALTDKAAAVAFSHGANSYGAISVDAVFKSNPVSDDETENSNNDNIFVSRNIVKSGAETSGGDDFEFDDLMIWISEYELKGRMVQAGALP